MKISATIITYNEERNIARAMESLRCCDEIVVVDSNSSDRTVEIAEKLGARVIENSWPGYAAQKNFAAAHATYDWILSLDADEALSEMLEAEICSLRKAARSTTATPCPGWRNILGNGFFIRVGIRIERSDCSTGASRGGLAT